ncbi:hypothetical protein QTP88_006363 [Uroleucon formosanum]
MLSSRGVYLAIKRHGRGVRVIESINPRKRCLNVVSASSKGIFLGDKSNYLHTRRMARLRHYVRFQWPPRRKAEKQKTAREKWRRTDAERVREREKERDREGRKKVARGSVVREKELERQTVAEK